MSKRLDFELEYLKHIERCKHKIAILSAEGLKAGFMVAALKTAIDIAETARKEKIETEMIASLHRMKELLK